MSNMTKRALSMSLKRMLNQKRLDDITIQDLVDDAEVSRKTFYYHFQDIYDVLLWIFDQQLGKPLREDADAELEDWCLQALALLEKDRPFYRRAFSAPEQVLMRSFIAELVRPRISWYLFQEDVEMLPQSQIFVVEFYTKAVVNYLVERITDRNAVNQEEARKCLRSLLAALRPIRQSKYRAQAG